MIARVKAAVVAFLARRAVRSALRHAATAAVGVLVAAIAVGGVHSITVGVLVAALAAAARVLELAVVAAVTKRRKAAAA